jgi:hypothetical protein
MSAETVTIESYTLVRNLRQGSKKKVEDTKSTPTCARPFFSLPCLDWRLLA